MHIGKIDEKLYRLSGERFGSKSWIYAYNVEKFHFSTDFIHIHKVRVSSLSWKSLSLSIDAHDISFAKLNNSVHI